MLALARSEGQSIIIDGNIEVKIVKWSRSSVRLAIQAPREVKVDRDEIWRRENPGKATPLEIAEAERRERFAREGVPAPGGAAAPAPVPGANEAHLLPLKATAAGKFFVRPTPDAPPFVHVGTTVEEETVVGKLEVAGEREPRLSQMMLAETRGVVAKILVSNGQMVEPGQSLFLLKPL